MQVGANPLTVKLYRRCGVWRPTTLLFRTAYLPVDLPVNPLETLLDWQVAVKSELEFVIHEHGEH